MARYASQTSVPADRSRSEIERTLTRYGAGAFMYGWEEDTAVVAFKAHDKTVRFLLPMPDSEEFTVTETGKTRTLASAEKAYEQALRQRWRALALAIKAKLEAVESEIVSFEDEFMAHFVLPTGETVGERLGPQMAKLATEGLPPLLPSGN